MVATAESLRNGLNSVCLENEALFPKGNVLRGESIGPAANLAADSVISCRHKQHGRQTLMHLMTGGAPLR